MEYICIVDTETTGLDPNKDTIIEIAAILFHIPTKSILAQGSTLLFSDQNRAEHINQIQIDSLKANSINIIATGLEFISEIMKKADVIIAHNSSFDKNFIESCLPTLISISRNKKWICTKKDVKWSIRKEAKRSLNSICNELNIPNEGAHRAMADCLRLLEAIKTNNDIISFLDKSIVGKTTYIAMITYEQRQLAKDLGFCWDNLSKEWKGSFAIEEITNIPFPIKEFN